LNNWKYNETKALAILLREYGITSNQALTEYTEDELQTLLSQLPIERIIKVDHLKNKMEIEAKYLEAFMDRDTETLKNAEDNFMIIEQRAKLKAQLRLAETEEEKSRLQLELDRLGVK